MVSALFAFKGFMNIKKNILDKLNAVGKGTIKLSKAGVPHLVYKNHSVCYFRKTDSYRVFWPYPSHEQDKKDFKSIEKLVEFLK